MSQLQLSRWLSLPNSLRAWRSCLARLGVRGLEQRARPALAISTRGCILGQSRAAVLDGAEMLLAEEPGAALYLAYSSARVRRLMTNSALAGSSTSRARTAPIPSRQTRTAFLSARPTEHAAGPLTAAWSKPAQGPSRQGVRSQVATTAAQRCRACLRLVREGRRRNQG